MRRRDFIKATAVSAVTWPLVAHAQQDEHLRGPLLYERGILGKWLAMLKEIAPQVKRAAVLGNPKVVPFDYFVGAAQAAGPELGIQVLPAPIQNAESDIASVITSFASTAGGAMPPIRPQSASSAPSRPPHSRFR